MARPTMMMLAICLLTFLHVAAADAFVIFSAGPAGVVYAREDAPTKTFVLIAPTDLTGPAGALALDPATQRLFVAVAAGAARVDAAPDRSAVRVYSLQPARESLVASFSHVVLDDCAPAGGHMLATADRLLLFDGDNSELLAVPQDAVKQVARRGNEVNADGSAKSLLTARVRSLLPPHWSALKPGPMARDGSLRFVVGAASGGTASGTVNRLVLHADGTEAAAAFDDPVDDAAGEPADAAPAARQLLTALPLTFSHAAASSVSLMPRFIAYSHADGCSVVERSLGRSTQTAGGASVSRSISTAAKNAMLAWDGDRALLGVSATGDLRKWVMPMLREEPVGNVGVDDIRDMVVFSAAFPAFSVAFSVLTWPLFFAAVV